jgi:hypothetical protein
MDALIELVPRQAGRQEVEPRIDFDVVEEAAHSAARCPLTCGCSSGTAVCVTTGITA